MKFVIIVQEVTTMNDKCTKYEALFTFADEKTFSEHLENCEDCQKEHATMERVSELISEVKPLYKQKKNQFKQLKVACILFALIFGGASIGVVGNQDFIDYVKYGETLSAEDLGFPVDSYGLLLVE